MLRTPKEPPVAPKPETINHLSNWHSLTCELITPMYGGGVKSTKVDIKMPIRASSIRGQLRFWWRLLAKNKWNIANIQKAESELWGGVGNGDDDGKVSKVLLRITDIKNANTEQWATYKLNERNGKLVLSPKDWADVAYALFPAQGTLKNARTQVDEEPHELLKAGCQWTLQIAFSHDISNEQKEQVWESVRWWANFGGVGARTRRGLGAVKVTENNFFQSVIPLSEIRELNFGVQIVSANNSNSAWVNAVKKLETFRQVGAGRNNHNSRSHWSEPDAIRHYTGQSLPLHSKRQTKNNAFPRASFGLPIIFKFKDNNNDGTDLSRDKDPRKTTLTVKYRKDDKSEWEKCERLASPLILRPYIDKEGKWHSLALVLDEVLCDSKHYQLMLDDWEVGFWSEDYANEVRPLQNRHQKPLQAFLKYFEGK